jgi:hypothetical protein
MADRQCASSKADRKQAPAVRGWACPRAAIPLPLRPPQPISADPAAAAADPAADSGRWRTQRQPARRQERCRCTSQDTNTDHTKSVGWEAKSTVAKAPREAAPARLPLALSAQVTRAQEEKHGRLSNKAQLPAHGNATRSSIHGEEAGCRQATGGRMKARKKQNQASTFRSSLSQARSRFA